MSHHRFMKKETTIRDFTTAIAKAINTFHGAGNCIHVTATVIKVKKKRVKATPQRNLADDM